MRLLEKVISVYGDKLKQPKKEILSLCQDFFLNRLRYIYEKTVFRYDLIQPGLNDFFDRVLVMAEENKLRRNRLALLQASSKVLLQIADYSQAVVEGEKPAARK
jgi:glycyl-tRNA synthetase beta subunit